MTFTLNPDQVLQAAEALQRQCHGLAKASGWWTDMLSGRSLVGEYAYMKTPGFMPPRNIAELLCLVHSEISEAMEGVRKGLMDDKLPNRPMLEVELADAVIRILDLRRAGHEIETERFTTFNGANVARYHLKQKDKAAC